MRTRWLGMLLLGSLLAAAAAMQVPLWSWEVEDAAISFAYAQNLAAGDGLVPQAGAERVEGFSNPTWVLLLAAASWCDFDLFVASRVLGLCFGVGAVAATVLAARPLKDTLPTAPWLAGGAVAVSATHAIWAQSGLENGLFSLLLALGIWRIAVGPPTDPWGPLLFLGLAWTRPEGPIYAALAMSFALARSQDRATLGRRVGVWVVLWLLPSLVLEVARIVWYAHPLPATFYAKIGEETGRPLLWENRGWRQLREYAVTTGAALAIPVLLAGAAGLQGRRGLLAIVASVTAGTAALPDGWLGADLRLAATCLALGALLALALGRPQPIGVAAALLLFGLFFHVATNGDWMRAWRWMSLIVVPGALLFGAGLAELTGRLGRAGPPLAGVALIAWAVPNVALLRVFAEEPETPPAAVLQRVDHWMRTARTLGLDRRLRIVDHDMGGNLLFAAEHAWVRDTRGLVDLPFALHGDPAALVRQTLLRPDEPFDFAHLHGRTRHAMYNLPEVRWGFVEIPGYPASDGLHGGQFVRRELFLEPTWPPEFAGHSFAGGVTLGAPSVVSPEVGPGSGFFVELPMRAEPRDPFHVLLFLVGPAGVAASWDLPPAYGWIEVEDWRQDEVFRGRFRLPLPETLALGAYTLGALVIDANGQVLPSEVPEVAPVLARGERRFETEVRVVSRDEMATFASEDTDAALAAARAGDCEAAADAWELAWRHRARSGEWRHRNRPKVAAAMAACWSGRAAAGSTGDERLLERVREIRRARDWDPRSPALDEPAALVAGACRARADAASTPDERFRWLDEAVRADPSRSWDRRAAEQLRPL